MKDIWSFEAKLPSIYLVIDFAFIQCESLLFIVTNMVSVARDLKTFEVRLFLSSNTIYTVYDSKEMVLYLMEFKLH